MIIRPEQLQEIKDSINQYTDKEVIENLLDTIIYLVEEYKSTTCSVKDLD